MRTPFVACLVFATGFAHAQSVSERVQRDELVFMQSEEPAMQKAFKRASDSLDDFLAKAKAQSPNHTAFSLKVAISQGKNTEYFWINNFVAVAANTFEGEIGNEPRMVKTVKLGQRYSFPRERVVDWTHIDKVQRQMVGNFTLCALLTKEPGQEAEAMKKRFKLDCAWLQ